MKMTKKLLSVLMLSLFCLIFCPVTAYAGTVSSVAATSDSGKVKVEGTAESGVLAVAVMVYDSSDKLVLMETTAVYGGNYAVTPDKIFADGDYTVKVADYNGGEFATAALTVGTVEETPTEETPVEETPVQETPAENHFSSEPEPAPAPEPESNEILVEESTNAMGQVISEATLKFFANDITVSGPDGATIKPASTNDAKKLITQARSISGQSAFFAGIVDLDYSGAGTFKLHCSNVWKGQKVYVLHLKSDGSIEKIIPDSVEDNEVTVTMTSCSPIAIVVETASVKSPKTGDIVAGVLLLLFAFGACTVYFGRKVKRA